MSPFGLSEIRGALRGLQRSPIIALSAVACIALGLGSTAAISSAVDRALVQRLPFRVPERIVTVYRTTPHFDTGPFSPLNYLDLARLTTSVSQLAAIGFGNRAPGPAEPGDAGGSQAGEREPLPHARGHRPPRPPDPARGRRHRPGAASRC